MGVTLETLVSEFDTMQAKRKADERDRVRALLLAMPALEHGCRDAAPRLSAAWECCDLHRGKRASRNEALDALTRYAGGTSLQAVIDSDLGQDVALTFTDSDRMRAYVNEQYTARGPRDLGPMFEDVGPLDFEGEE